MLVALMAVPFASSAQAVDETHVVRLDAGNFDGYTGGTTQFNGYNQLVGTATPSWTYADLAVNGLEAGHYYNTLFQGGRYQWLVTPAIDLMGLADAQVTYSVALTAFNGSGAPDSIGADKKFIVLASTDGLNWTALRTYTGEALAAIPATWDVDTVDLADYKDSYPAVYLAFYTESAQPRTGNATFHIGNIAVDGHLKCQPVSDVVATTVTTNSVTIAWTNDNPKKYGHQVLVYQGAELVDSVFLAASARTYSKDNLTPATVYTFMVRTSCDGNGWLDATPINVFTHYPINIELPYENNFEAENSVDNWFFSRDTTNGWFRGRVLVDSVKLDTYVLGDVIAQHIGATDTAWKAETEHVFPTDIDSTATIWTVDERDTNWNYSYNYNYVMMMSKDSGATASYNTSGSRCYYTYFPIELEAGDYNLGFDWRGMGEDKASAYDYMAAYLAPEDADITFNQTGVVPSSWTLLDGKLWRQTEWQKYYYTFKVAEANHYHLVFVWRNNNSGGSGNAAMFDNLIFNKVICYPVTDVAVVDSMTTGTSLTVSFTGMGEGFEGSYRGVAKAGDVTVEATAGANESTMTFVGLKGETTYSISLYTVCGEGNESNPTSAVNGTTLPTCYPVENLAVVADSTTANRLQIAWVDTKNTEPTYQVRVMKGADTVDIVTTQDTSFSISNLKGSTTYTFYVRPICGVDDSAQVRSVSGQTAIEFLDIVNYVNDFEGANAAEGWMFLHHSGSNRWYIGTPTTEGYNGSLFVSKNGTACEYNNGSATRTAAMLPVHFDEADYSYSFDAMVKGENNWDYLEAYLVPASLGVTAAQINSLYRSTAPAGWMMLGSRLQMLSSVTTVSNELSFNGESAGDYFLLFFWGNDGSGGSAPAGVIDNIRLTKVICGAPANLAVADRTGSTVDLTWECDFHADDVTYLVANVGVDTTAVTGVLAHQLTGLAVETDLTIKVGMVCSYGDTLWSDAIATRTLGACNAPENLTVSNVARASFDLSWTQAVSNVDNYDLIIATEALTADSLANYPVEQMIAVSGNDGYTATNLNRDQQYYVYFRAHCAAANSVWNSEPVLVKTKSLVECGTAIVADGTTTNNYVLLRSSYQDDLYKSQVIYPADMLTELVGKPINSMTFYTTYSTTTGYSGDWSVSTMKFYLNEVEESTLSARNGNTGTVVYEGTTTYNSADKTLTYNFNTPFIYTGTGNLMLTLDYTNANSGYSSGGFYGVSTSSNTAWCQYSSYTKTFLPKVAFDYCLMNEACPALTELEAADVDVNTATLTWTAADADYLDGYELYVTAENVDMDTVTTGTIAVAKTATSYDLSELTQATNYHVYLRSLCARDNDTSAWSTTSFLTMEACRAATDLVVEQNATNGAHVSWVNGGAALNQADDFTVAWSTNINEDPSAAEHVINVTDATETDVTGLPYNSTVYFWVKHNCSDLSLSSGWLGPDSVKTSVDMPKVDSLTAVPTHSTIAATWKRNEAEFATENQWKVALKDMTNQDATVWSLIDHTDTLFYGLPNAHAFMVGVIAVNGTNESDTTWKIVSTTALPDPCVQVGTGTTGSSSIPYAGWYHNSYSQQIFTAEEIGNEGTISSISFQYTKTTAESRNITIFMGTTDETSLASSWIYPSNMTEVFHAAQVTFSNESDWFNIALDVPFEYTGGNIVVAMYMNYNSNESGYGSGNRFNTHTATNKARYITNDDETPDYFTLENGVITNTTSMGNSSSTRNNTVFCFDRDNPCLKPTQVAASNITTNSATVSWMPGNSETAWQYAYSDSVMSDEVLATAATDINSLNVSLSGLLGDKDYHFYVRANCGEESYSEWSHVMFPTQLSCERPVLVTAEAEDSSIAFAAYAGVTGSPEGMTLRYWTAGNEPTPMTMVRNDRYDTTWTLTDPAEVASVDTVVRFVATVENLNPLTFYHYQVQTLCLATEGNSRWTEEDSVRTLCDGTVTLPYTEDFKATSLNRDCWTAEILDDNAAMPYFGPNGLYLNGSYTSSVNGDRYFISPRFNAEDTLVWKSKVYAYNYVGYSYTYNDSVSFGYSMTDDEIESFVWIDKVGNSVGTNYTYYVPAGAKYVAYHYEGRTNSSYVGDISLSNVVRRTVTIANADPEMGDVYVMIGEDTIGREVTNFQTVVFDGTKVKLAAQKADQHHKLVNWTGANGEQALGAYYSQTITVSSDTSLTAHFALNDYTLTVSNYPANHGVAFVVDSVVNGVNHYTNRTDSTMVYGTSVTVIAIDTAADDHYHFAGWSTNMTFDNVVSTDTVYTLTPDKDGSLYALFAIDSVTYVATANPAEGGVVEGFGPQPLGSTVHMNATPNYGYHFGNWTDAAGEEITTDLTFDTVAAVDAVFTANFAKDPFYMLVGVNEPELGTATANPDFGLYNDVITLVATPTAAHYHFERWTDGNTESPREFHITQDTIMMAYFAIDEHTVTLAAREDMGAVKINNEDTNMIVVDYGTEINIEAIPNTGVRFVNWSDGVEDAQRTIEVVRDSNLTAVFDSINYNIVLNYNEAEGAVKYNNVTVDSGYVFVARYGDSITLTQEAETGYRFSSWVDGASNVYNTAELTYYVTAVEAQSITANFIEGGKWNVSVFADNLSNLDTAGGLVASAGTYNNDPSTAGRYDENTVVALHATPKDHYRFVAWMLGDDVYSFAADTTVQLGAAIDGEDNSYTFRAQFQLVTFELTVEPNIAEGGEVTVTVNGEETDDNIFDYGTEITINATANTDDYYHFVNWNNGENMVAGTYHNPEYTFTLEADAEYTAVFALDTVTLTVVANDEQFGTVTGGGEYPYGTVATLTAEPAEGYTFIGWSTNETTDTITYEVRVAATVTATFDTAIHTVTANVNDNERGVVKANGVGVTAPLQVKHFTNVALVAAPRFGFVFDHWANAAGETIGTNDTLVISPVSDSAVTAVFGFDQFTVTTGLTDPETMEGMGIAEIVGPATVNYRDSVTLRATANTGFDFTGWSNGMSEPEIRVQVLNNTTITAGFAYHEYVVYGTSNDNVMGTVEHRGVSHYGFYDTLIANANYGYHFVNWDGIASNTNDTMRIYVVANESHVANFAKNQYTATATVDDAARGYAYVNNPAPFYLDQVTFTAGNLPHYTFAGWANEEGEIVSTVNPLNVTINGDTTLIATFDSINFTVTVATADATMGSVEPAGDSVVLEGTVFQATATPEYGYAFVNWSNGATTPTVTVIVNEDITLTANFRQIARTVTVATADATMGSVNPAGDSIVLEGTVFQATATPAAGYEFVNWSNGDTTLTVTIVVGEEDVTLTANFRQITHSVTIAVAPGCTNMGTVSPAGTQTVAWGTTFTATATPNQGYQFAGWSNGATTATVSFTVNEDITLYATFEPVPVQTYTVTATANDATMGRVLNTGVYEAGTTVSLYAEAYPGYHFVRWSNTETANPLVFEVNEDVELVAIFEANVGIEDVDGSNVTIFSNDSKIVVRGAENMNVYIYDVNGRIVRSEANVSDNVEFTMANTGVYLVKVGNAPAKRVVVMR